MRMLDGRGTAAYCEEIKSIFTNASVSGISITDGGTSYSVGDPVIITGDGSGATAEVGSETGGVIDSITVTNGGSGYTYANVDASASGDGNAVLAATIDLDLMASLQAFDESSANQNSRFEQVLSNALTSLPLSSEEAAIVKAVIEAL
ncbi:hypothetical protein QFX18_15220 [Saccharophagus degradans]|uniref:hypothetical protein n=1 Tax=Saccharophagus degradans TaxID=86304 RepID=UPI0024782692|nr:hypothetical protein [Saccharophagus degradans]WGO97386.1 hypothetical protein QFX18_15220 [Saccharophagus degradans]